MRVPVRGFSLVELLVALTLGSVLVAAGWSVLRRQTAAAAAARDLSDRLEVVRTVRTVLDEELRAGLPGRDWSVSGGDSVHLRAYRGVALGCPGSAGGDEDEVLVRYLGMRLPEPEKDSLLVLDEHGGWGTASLEARVPAPDSTGGCGAPGTGWRVERWSAPGVPRPLRVARLFERGGYHLADGALRYRSGRGGRQPLTPELLDDGASGLIASLPSGPVRIRAGFRSTEDGRGGSPGPFSHWKGAVWPAGR